MRIGDTGSPIWPVNQSDDPYNLNVDTVKDGTVTNDSDAPTFIPTPCLCTQGCTPQCTGLGCTVHPQC